MASLLSSADELLKTRTIPELRELVSSLENDGNSLGGEELGTGKQRWGGEEKGRGGERDVPWTPTISQIVFDMPYN